MAPLPRQRRRGAQESVEGHRRHVRQGRVGLSLLPVTEFKTPPPPRRSGRRACRRGTRCGSPARRARRGWPLALVLALSSLYVVSEGEQALVVRLGAPVAVVETPGLKFKVPFIDTRLRDLDPGRCCSSRRSSRRSWATRSGSRSSLTPATGSSIRCASIRRCGRPRRRSQQLGLLVSRPRAGRSGRRLCAHLLTDERGKLLDAIKAEVAERPRPSASRSTRCGSAAPTCRSRPARRSTTG